MSPAPPARHLFKSLPADSKISSWKLKMIPMSMPSNVHAVKCPGCGQAYEIYQKDPDSDMWYFIPRQVQ